MKKVISMCVFFFIQGNEEKHERIFVQDITVISLTFYHSGFLNCVG